MTEVRFRNNNRPEQLCSLCLTSIVKNFEFFITTYTFGSSIWQKHCEFLQRKYSIALLKELLHSSNFRRYVKFVLNPHLKEVNLDWRNKNYIPPVGFIFNRLKEIGSSVSSLNLASSDFSNDYFEEHASLVFVDYYFEELASFLPNVTSLSFRHSSISESALRSIGKHCKNLKVLKLSDCLKVTDQCIAAFCFPDNNANTTCTNMLQYLDIEGTSVTILGVICALKNIKCLLVLQHDFLMDALSKLHFSEKICSAEYNFETYNLESLKIEYIAQYPIRFIKLCSIILPNLKELIIWGMNSQSQIDVLMNFSSLIKVDLCFDDEFEGDLSLFFKAKGKYLKNLCLACGKISVHDIIQFCPKLMILEIMEFKRISNLAFNVKDAKSKALLKNLKELTLYGYDFHNVTNASSTEFILSRAPNLKTLNFSDCSGLSHEFIKSIVSGSWIQSIEDIDLGPSDVTFYGAKEFLLNAPNLKIIKLCDTPEEIAKCTASQLRLANPPVSVEIYCIRYS